MSDYENDMDVDAPLLSNTIQFNSDNVNAKGKRIVADLPVEAEDNLPWYGSHILQLWTAYVLSR
jgi:replication factor C subunit 3/5